MSNTGLLILTNPSRVRKLLPTLQRHVLQTLYIQYSPHPKKALTPLKSQITPKTISSIYTLASSLLSRIDVRLLLSTPHPPAIVTRRPIELVIFDEKTPPEDAQLLINNLLKNRGENCSFIALDLEDDEKTLQDNIPEENSRDYGNPLDESEIKSYQKVILGGTFDRLHNGHKILLTEAALRCDRQLTVGVVDDSMIQGKILWELIEPCSQRISAVTEFLEDVDSSIEHRVLPISDMYGPTKDEVDLDLLVVSEETRRGGSKVNEKRRENGLKELAIHVVDLAEDAEHRDHEEAKISSSTGRMRILGTRLKVPDIRGKGLKPYIVGLTGGIASGKSSIAEKLQALGAGVVHCDKLAHELYEPGREGFQKVVEVFGEGVLTKEGRIDRAKLGKIVFDDKSQLDRLNKAVWPCILDAALAAVQRLCDDHYEIIIMEAAVLIQAQWQSVCHEIWTCIIPHEEAVKRMIERNGLSRAEAEARIKVQPSNVQQVEEATVVFSTLWSHAITLEQVNRAWTAVHQFLLEKS